MDRNCVTGFVVINYECVHFTIITRNNIMSGKLADMNISNKIVGVKEQMNETCLVFYEAHKYWKKI